jgi:hypothetical protein
LKGKIGFIISIQVLILVLSFLVLVYFENQSTFLGNSINISGKNRFLAESLYTKITDYPTDANQKQVTDVMTAIDDNILALSHGGVLLDTSVSSSNEVAIMVVPPIFSSDLKQVQDKWSSYRSVIRNILDLKNTQVMQGNLDLENKKSQFISAADNLTFVLGKYSKEQVSNLILLQLLLLGINVITHILLFKLILNILQRDYKQKLLIEQVTNNNKQLSIESKISLLQKDILESFLHDMKDDLQKLKNQVSVMDFPNEYHNNRFVFHEIMTNLSTRIEELAGSKQELDDNISYYQKLNLNIAKNLSVLSGSKHDSVKKSGDVTLIIQSYVDGINFLISNQKIPARLGKRLTDIMYEIMDGLEQLKTNK